MLGLSIRNYISTQANNKSSSAARFSYDSLTAPSLTSLISHSDIERIRVINSTISLSAQRQKRREYIDEILSMYGFVYMTGGTNRNVYKHVNDDRFVLKVGMDDCGKQDSPREFSHQKIFKPFVAKCFDVSPCGTLGLFERVAGFSTPSEFLAVSPLIYELIQKIFIGEYICGDIGSEYFKNWGIREGFGPVLLDYPYVYRVDPKKMFCSKVDRITHERCNGSIEYGIGFNYLYCSKCGAMYTPREVRKSMDDIHIDEFDSCTCNEDGIFREAYCTEIIEDDGSIFEVYHPRVGQPPETFNSEVSGDDNPDDSVRLHTLASGDWRSYTGSSNTHAQDIARTDKLKQTDDSINDNVTIEKQPLDMYNLISGGFANSMYYDKYLKAKSRSLRSSSYYNLDGESSNSFGPPPGWSSQIEIIHKAPSKIVNRYSPSNYIYNDDDW